jgi:D-alanyl-lipoteichoic acid acyltransferase DltB (MBOAT superfamily)
VLFPTVTFALFFVIVLPLNWLLLPHRGRWSVFIITASYIFYGWWNPRFVLLLLAVTVWNQVMGLTIHRLTEPRARKLALGIAVAGDLGILAYFKYTDFLLVSGENLASSAGIQINQAIWQITLPVGISFFTFQAMSYIIDIYRRRIEPTSWLDFAVYQSFFPHLEAGPIVRASEFLPQLRRRPDPRRVDASLAFFLIMSGLFKKVVLSDLLSQRIVDPVFAAPSLHSGPETLLAVYAYAAQIYCDFSGYTDIAIGLALLLGFRFPQNFNGPYTAVSIQDFWRRWHMTLSRWLRDYLYIPLGGNRHGRLNTYRNLMLTMLLGGLWHGASWTFVIWGAWHGSFLCLDHWRGERREARGLPEPVLDRRARIIRRVVTFNIVCVGWVFFRATSFLNAWDVFKQIPQHWSGPSPLITASVVLATVAGIACQYIPPDWMERLRTAFAGLSPAKMGLALGIGLFVIDALGPQGVSPFIYYAF